MRHVFQSTLKLSIFLLMFVVLSGFWPFSGSSSVVKMKIKTTDATNTGVPFYVYIKEVEKGEFLKSEYQQIVHEAFPFTDEGPELQPQVIIPGKKCKFKIPRQHPQKQLGFYFLFTNPGDDWKLLVNASKKVNITLGETEIISTKSK